MELSVWEMLPCKRDSSLRILSSSSEAESLIRPNLSNILSIAWTISGKVSMSAVSL